MYISLMFKKKYIQVIHPNLLGYQEQRLIYFLNVKDVFFWIKNLE